MSSLWTPYGEHESEPSRGGDDPRGGAPRTAPPGEPAPGEPDEAEVREAMARLAATPVEDIVANHAIGLWQLAVLHLGLGPEAAPDVAQAALALDAMAALVEGLGDRLGENAATLRDALAQLRLAYVQVTSGEGVAGSPVAGDDDPGEGPAAG